MRLLFIYFYKDFGTFEKGSIVHLSKKYKFTLDEKNSIENKFYFNKEENPNFIENFYSENIDIGVLIGENGTGKSVLLNSIRDKKNKYSICVYEEENGFSILENDLFKIEENELYRKKNIPFEEDKDFIIKIENEKVLKKRNLKSIYYSSILEKINENLNDDFDVSNIYLLNKIDENNLEKKLELLEINDLHKMSKFNYDIESNPSKTFFEDAKEFIKDSYILLFEKTMNEIRNKKDSEKFEQIYHQLSDFIRKDIIKFYFDEEKLHISEFKNDEALVNEYLEKYEKDFEHYFIIHNIDKNEIFVEVEQRMKVYKNQLFNDIFIDELLKIDFNISKKSNEEIKIILDEIKDLFKFKISHPLSKNTDEKKIFMYFNIKKILETCIEIIKFKTSNIKQIKKIFNLYKIYYLSIEFGILDDFMKNLFMKNKINDLLLFDKKVIHHKFPKINEEFIDYKQKTINEIKQIIENNYSLFYDEVINDLKNLDDKIIKLSILKKVEEFIKEIEKNPDNTFKAIYIYLAYLIKKEFLEDDEKEFLNKDLKDERDFKFELLVLYNKKGITPLIQLEKIDFYKYNEFIKNTIHPFSFTFNPPISSGQKAKEIINARINDAIQKINQENPNENILILLDEADLKLHLEWQRKFVFDLIEFLNSYPNNKFYILYATHSPMILSDITNDRVVFLKKEENSNFSEDKQDFTKSTFCANIYDIYADSFFVDDFMGKFAQTKIDKIINLIESHKKDKQTISKNQVPNLLKIVKNIGEPLLRNKLEDEIKFLFDIKDDISQIADTLKDKNFEEIKQELNKYSQDKQKEILEKLFGN